MSRFAFVLSRAHQRLADLYFLLDRGLQRRQQRMNFIAIVDTQIPTRQGYQNAKGQVKQDFDPPCDFVVALRMIHGAAFVPNVRMNHDTM
jgi:hypothetical protein